MGIKEKFLKSHMDEIVQSIRNPIQLADTLLSKEHINDEMYAKIKVKEPIQEKTREIYAFLKSEGFNCTYDWLKKNESDVFKELKKSDRETEAPRKKRQRVENEDETDNTGFADLKMICTFAKLEKWVSTPEIGEKLISDLERKLGNDGMEDLENGLKDKEPKNVLCFNAHNIDEIRKNKELTKFLSTTEATTIPKLTYSMFKKGGSGSSENKNQIFSDVEEFIDVNADVSSSGYESLLSSTFNDGDMDNMTSVNKDEKSESKTTEQLHGQLVVPMDHEVKANGPSQEPMDMQDTYIDKEQCQILNIVAHKEMNTHQNEQTTNKVTPLENGFVSMDMQDTHIDQMNDELQKSMVPNFPRHEVDLCPNDKITKKETPLEDELRSTVMKYKHIDETDDEPKRSSVPRNEDVLQISSTKPSLEDGMKSADVQVADTDETYEKTQRLHFLNVQMDEDVFMDKNEKIQKSDKDVIMHLNESTTKIKRPLEDRLGRTVLQDAHIDWTHDEPKISNVPINEDVLLYENEQIIKEGTQQQDRLGRIKMKDTPIDEIDEEPEKSNFPISEDVLLDQSEQITSKESLLEDGFKSTDMQDSDTEDINDECRQANVPHAPPYKSIYLGQNESIAKTKTPLQDKHRSVVMRDTHTDETNDEPKRSSVPRNEDELLYENKQINSKEAPLEDRYESMDVQDADIEDINDEPQRSNVFDVLPHGSIYLCQNEPITKMETPLENKSPTTDIKEIEEINVQPQRSSALVHEDVTMHENESHTKNKTPLENKLRSTVMQDTQNYEINDEHKRLSAPRNEEVLYQNELITNKEAPLGDEIENMDVQDADIEDMNDEPQRSNVPDVLTQRNIYLNHNNSTTNIETPLEDGLRSTVMKNKHIDETNDGPKNSIVPRNEDVLLYQNEQIINKEPALEHEVEKTDMQDADNDQINMKPQQIRFQNVPSHDNVGLNKNVKFTIRETPLENTRSNVPIDEDVLLYQNEQTTRKKTPLEDELESMNVQDVDFDDISEKPQILCLTNDDVLLYQNEQINNKEAPLEDEHESTDMQNADIEKMNDEPQRSNDSIVPTKGSIYLCQNEPIIKIGPPAENNPGRTDMKENEQMNVQSQRSNVAVREGVTKHQNESPTKNKTPLEDKLGRTDRQNTHINKADVPKRSIVPGYENELLYENEQITSKAAPLEDELKSMVVQDAAIDDIRENPQRLYSTNAPRHEDVFLDKNDTFSQKQPPLENTLGSRNIHEIGEEPQRSGVANIPIYGDTFLHQNDQLTNKATPVVNESGSIDKKEMMIDKMDEEPLRSNVLMITACLPQTESIINSKMPLQDRGENVNMQPSEPAVTLVNPEPLSLKPLQQNNPGPALENTHRIDTEIWAQNRATGMEALNNELKRRNESMKKREKSKQQRQKKKNEKDQLLYNWAKSQCNDHEKIENILDNISIINMAEHSEYPCFTAENVMVYKYLTPESKILFITNDKSSINTLTTVQYQMFVCNIKNAVLLGPQKTDKREIQYDKSSVPITKCKNFIFQAFAPALVVYKKIQKEKYLYSLSKCSE